MIKYDGGIVIRALEELYALDALDDKGALTPLGKRMAALPLDPMYARCLIAAEELQITSDMVDLISLLSVEGIFYSPPDKREEAASARSKFVAAEGSFLRVCCFFDFFFLLSV
jgi:HrpA-like RNA helicase